MNKERLEKHIKLCRRNLRSTRVKCCTTCPFKEEILSIYPELAIGFYRKESNLLEHGIPIDKGV